MSALLGSIWPYIGIAGAALLVVWRVLAGAKKAGVDEQKAKEAVARAQDIKKVQDANVAGSRVQPDDPGVQYDPHNRDTWNRKT